jgi:hypothetical protein
MHEAEMFLMHCAHLTARNIDRSYGHARNQHECALMAYRIVLLAYATDIRFDPVKTDGLIARLHGVHGRKIFHDARTALLFVKAGRTGDRVDIARCVRRYSKQKSSAVEERIAADISEWTGLVT